jgi:hypothetical protein
MIETLTELERLPETINTNGHTYTQIMRTESKAIYEQRTKAGILAGHEVFKIILLPAEKVFNREYPQREKFPSASDFGVTAFSTGIRLDNAINRFNSLENN